MNKFWYRMFIFILLVCLLGIGAVIGYQYTKKVPMEEQGEIKANTPEDQVHIYTEDEEVEPVSTKKYNLEVKYIDEYTLCHETIEDANIHYGVEIEEVISQEKKKQKEEKKEYQLTEQDQEKVVFKRIMETYCPYHYKVILEEGNIHIYQRITEEKQEEYQTLDIPADTLRVEVINELTGGILVNSKEELKSIIEDIES